jgi:threonine dehydrogenase-like Zn-dependent dehydrogenase
MRAPFQAGDVPAPVKFGYCNVGVVEQGPAELIGRRVFCLYPHQDRYVVPVGALHALPGDLPPGRAVLAANLETAVNALWDAAPCVGDRVAVIGAGTVGCLAAWLAARIVGTEVELIDVDERKAAAARALGVPFRAPDAARGDVDVVIHTSGSAAGLATALALAGFEATVVELSWYGDEPPAVPLGGAFHSRRLTLRSSQVGSVATAQRARWGHARRMQLVMRLLENAELDALVTGDSPFEELPAVLARLASAPGYTLTHRIVY